MNFRKLIKLAGLAGLAALTVSLGALPGCTRTGSPVDGDNIVVASRGYRSPFKLVVDPYASSDSIADAEMFCEVLKNKFGTALDRLDPAELKDDSGCLLVFGAYDVPECSDLMLELKNNEYAIGVYSPVDGSGRISVCVAYKGGLARRAAIDLLLTEYCSDETGRFAIPAGTVRKGSVDPGDLIITTNVSLRDPCVLNVDGTYYMYGTGWVYYKNTSGNLAGPWEGPTSCVTEKPAESDKQYWAPEVHEYNGAYYMFTTYHKAVSDHRGCVILRADSPEGPFEMWSDGHVTPANWDCIDGTLYVDPTGQPWLVFVHEWTSLPDSVGNMAVAKLSADLKQLSSEPKEIFRANETAWASGTITDGPWLYTAANGDLLMIWSNFDPAGYAVGVARSTNGKIDGKWEQLNYELFSKNLSCEYDGGHGMFFRDTNGQLYLSIHSPNDPVGGRKTLAIFVPIREEGNLPVWDFN